jgi:hypothetical protein
VSPDYWPVHELSRRPRDRYFRSDQGRCRSGNSHHLFTHLPQLLVLGIPASCSTSHFSTRSAVGSPTSAFRGGSLVICHCLLRRFVRRISSRIGGLRVNTPANLGGANCLNFQNSAEVSQSTCRLPSRVIRDETELHLPDEPEI